MHGASRDDAFLMVLGDDKDDVVLQNIQGVVHGVDSKVCWPLQANLWMIQHQIQGQPLTCSMFICPGHFY